MKQILQFLVLVMYASSLGAQTSGENYYLIHSDEKKVILPKKKINLKDYRYNYTTLHRKDNSTVNRSALTQDTLEYPFAKANGVRAISLNNATSAQAFAQYFDAPGEVSISGATFFGWKGDLVGGISVDLDIEVYAVGADSLPIGSPLVSKTFAIDTTFGSGNIIDFKRIVTFDNSIVVAQPYTIVIKNLSPSNVQIIFNDYTQGDGEQEWLANFDLFGNWTRPYDIVIGGNQADADALIYPHVSYALFADFDMDPPTNTGTNTVTVTSNGPTDSFIENRMYNVAAFPGMELNPSYNFNFGDGTVQEGKVSSHTYANSNPQDIALTSTVFGWTATFASTETKVWSPALNIEEFDISEIQLFPNPTTNVFTIKNADQKIKKVNVADINGKVVKTFRKEEEQYSIKELSSGIYFVTVKTDKGKGTLKLIKD